MARKQIKSEIKKVYGTLSENEKGYALKLTLTSWNDMAPKVDLRTWNGTQGYKGVTMTRDELIVLKDAIDVALADKEVA